MRRVAAWLGGGIRPWRLFRLSYHNERIEADYTRTMESFRPDVVHVQHLKDLSGGLLGLTAQRGIPLLMTLHDYWPLCPNAQLVRPSGTICLGTHARFECGACAADRLGAPLLGLAAPAMMPLFWLRDRAVRREMRRGAMYIAPSRFLRQAYVRAGYPEERLVVLENGLDMGRVQAAQRPLPELYRGHYAYLGSLVWHKGAHVLAQAFRHLGEHGAQLRIWGNPTTHPGYVARLRALAEGCPWISIEGELDRGDVSHALAWADYLVVPSLWWENSPTTILEAHASGVPVIASNLGALPEKVQDGICGLLFAPGDADDLGRVLRRTIAQPDLLPQLRAHIPKVVSMTEHASEIEGIYERLRATY